MQLLLRNSIIEGNEDRIASVLSETPSLIEEYIESSVKGNFPIHWAAVAVNGTPLTDKIHPLSALRAVLEFENQPDRPNLNGATALHLVSTQKSDTKERFDILASAIKMLCQRGANVNLFDRGGNAPLHLASRFSDIHNEVNIHIFQRKRNYFFSKLKNYTIYFSLHRKL